MNCNCCPHKEEFALAVRPCRYCENAHVQGDARGDSRACAKCEHFPAIKKATRPCDKCDAGRLHGEVHVDASPEANVMLARALPNDHTPMDRVTTLAAEVEDALRKALCVIFDLTPIELLLLQHFMHRRTPAAFRETLAKLRDRLNNKYDLSEDSTSFRAVCNVWKNGIIEKFPRIEDLFAAVIDEAKTSRHTRHVTDEEFGDDQGEN